MAIEFLKGHGTQNDFVLLPDPDGRLELTPGRVAALCDRRRGLGADGVLRVVRSTALGLPSEGEWFMDYRNADGSVAEMCGNGMRVFARYLAERGLAEGPEFLVGSRAGDKPVVVHPDGTVTVHMGPASVTGASVAIVDGRDFSGVAVNVGNPHLVSVVDGDVAELDLREEPRYDEDFFPEGVNLEFVNPLGEGALRMRVYERGVGETRSCGTGTVAAVAAALHLAGTDTGESTVDVPGGRVTVTMKRGESTLTGPAEFVARGELVDEWWAAQE
ncbi:diaminopimelate epimerase [Amycolatopsis acidiphila]|uniref:Diaminopimelate epimerase n=1 Tax=Amycolatopsis acidiphila TaxID=715473 RepID=A0A557ZYP8_9PSEU|nr:diaminopimelate epimerase [Amycolatopsis acidiphila]TVT17133.1 diaminopimelate epimerase [Amycolatopsis acidiphila]UIJ58324.1 diaminopimelate epimerase [Amycolatopsis acidiphila]GHG95616.1 diaminopimelate epimerase [Amycolatopsis acidiphila]